MTLGSRFPHFDPQDPQRAYDLAARCKVFSEKCCSDVFDITGCAGIYLLLRNKTEPGRKIATLLEGYAVDDGGDNDASDEP